MNRPLIRPGRHLSQAPVHAPNAALLIDFDNVTLGVQKDLTKELRTLLNSDIIKGKVAVQRAYADWRRYPQYIVSLSESSIDLIFAPAFGSTKKNATDIRLAIDAIELVFTRPEIGTFILLSGDSDFSTMVIKLKEYGKYVIGVGIRESASDLLIQNCDEYYSYNDLAGLTKEVDTPSIQRDPWELAGHAVAQMARNGDVMRSDRLKQVMQQIDPNFDERNAGFNRFSKFVLEAGQRGVVTVTKLDNGQFEVAPGPATVGPPATAPAAPAARPRDAEVRDGRDGRDVREGREGREDGARGRRGRGGRGRGERQPDAAGRESPGREAPGRETPSREAPSRPTPSEGTLSLARAFQLMTQALVELRGPVGQEALRLRMAALHGREDPLLDPSRFPRLLRQANDAEIADVRKVGEDDYEISARRTAGMTPPAPSAASAAPAAPSEPETPPPADTAEYEAEPAAAEVTASGRENGMRYGVRFRRGSRGGLRTGEIPLVGVVRIEEPVETVPAPAASDAVEQAPEVEAKPARPRRAPRKKASTTRAKSEAATAKGTKVEPPVEESAEAAPPPAKRPRSRARKKAE
ncbi:MAG TPA: NYN domain-containing protein [Gemmatimonadales bacterium]|nr:NYN domain-containing protein [Gemmatimonadales bacterium]